MGRSADRLFASKNRGTRTAFAFAIRQGARDEDRHLAKRRAHRLDSLPRTIGECRFRKSRPEIRADKSTGLRPRMHRCDLFPAEKGIRYTAKTRARCYRASQADAGAVKTGAEYFAKAGKALRAACGPIGAFDRSAIEQKLDA